MINNNNNILNYKFVSKTVTLLRTRIDNSTKSSYQIVVFVLILFYHKCILFLNKNFIYDVTKRCYNENSLLRLN